MRVSGSLVIKDYLYFDYSLRTSVLVLAAMLVDFLPLARTLELRAKGPPSVAIPVRNARAVGHAHLLQAPLNLWCQGVNGRTMEVVPVEEVTFRHNGQKHYAQVSGDGLNATFMKEPASANDAGIWTCRVTTKSHGSATGDISVFLRPVVVSNFSLRIDDKETKSKHHPNTNVNTFEASGITVVRGENAVMECPIVGFPRPPVQWRSQNGVPLGRSSRTTVQNGVLTIRNVTDEDGDVYICSATNTFSIRGQTQHNSVIVERRLRVKSEYAWLIPLGIIIVTVILLVTIIALCELRKRRNEQKQLLGTAEEE